MKLVLTYGNDPPGLLQPGNLGGIVTEAEQRLIAMRSGFWLLDLTSGAQETYTVEVLLVKQFLLKRVKDALNTLNRFL